jgi:hypothetical protein
LRGGVVCSEPIGVTRVQRAPQAIHTVKSHMAQFDTTADCWFVAQVILALSIFKLF